jgi:uncharacterized protein with NRDE domain
MNDSNQEQEQANLPDYFLQSLVTIVNLSDSKIPITIHTSGFLVSGYLIGGRNYFEQFADDFTNLASTEEQANLLKDAILENTKLYSEERIDSSNQLPTFIHLSTAKFYDASGNSIPAPGMLWRGRISQVIGFTLGIMTQSHSVRP